MTQRMLGPYALLLCLAFMPGALRAQNVTDASRAPVLAIQNGHSSEVQVVVYSRDGRFFASGSEGGAVKLWEAGSNRLLRTIEGSFGAITGLGFSPDGQYLACAAAGDTVKLWDTQTGQMARELAEGSANSNGLAFHPDGKLIATAHNDDVVKVWNAEDGSLAQTLTGHASNVSVVAYSPDGKVLASGSGDRTIKLWSAESGELLQTLEGHENGVHSLAFSPDSQTLASYGFDAKVKRWQANNGRLLSSWGTGPETIGSLTFSPEGRFLLTGNEEGAISVRSLANGAVARTLAGSKGQVSALAFNPSGRLLLSSGESGTLKVWEFSSGRVLATLKSHSVYAVSSLAFSPDGTLLAVGCGDALVRLWSLADGQLVRVLKGHEDWVAALAFSPDGRYLASGSDDDTVKIWEVASGRRVRDISAQEGDEYGASILSLAFSRDGRWLAAGHDSDKVKVWSATTWQLRHTLSAEQYMVRSVAFSPDGQTVAAGAESRQVTLWSTASGQVQRALEAKSSILSVAYSSDGQAVMACRDDGVLQAWSVANGQQLSAIEVGEAKEVEAEAGDGYAALRATAQSPGGLFYAAGGYDGTVRVWNAKKPQLIWTLDGHTTEIWALSFSPDGRFVASGGIDHTVKIWSLANGQPVLTLLGFGGSEGLAYTKDGYYTATPGAEQFIGWTAGDKGYEAAQFRAEFNKPTLLAARLRAVARVTAAFPPRDTKPPELRIIAPLARGVGVGVGEGRLSVIVEARDESGVDEVRVAGVKARPKANDQFAVEVALQPGLNQLTVEARDKAGNRSQQTFQVTRNEAAVSGVPAFRYYALVIGNNRYTRLGPLVTAVKDAETVAAELSKSYGFETKVLRDATRAAILDALAEYSRTMRENDCLLIYYAGHGYYNKTEVDKAYWQPVDADARSRTNWIIADDITSSLKLIPSRHILVVSDSCYSGTLTRAANETTVTPSARERFLAKVAGLRSRVLIASGGNEPVSDEGPGGHSVFASAFLYGLRNMERDVFTAEELFRNYVRERVGGNSEQLPEYKYIQNSGHDGGDFIFKRKYR